MPAQYTIGTLAKVAGVSVETIRYYQGRSLVEEPARPLGGTRRYTEAHARRLRFIKEAQKMGFTLDEVAELLTLEDGQHCRAAERIGLRKLTMVRERIAQLSRIEHALAKLVEECHCNTGRVRCPLITSLEVP